jgi:hypothetical protein
MPSRQLVYFIENAERSMRDEHLHIRRDARPHACELLAARKVERPVKELRLIRRPSRSERPR